MQSMYKETIRDISNRQVKKIWDECALNPNFKMRDLIEKLGGNIYPDIDGRLADYEEAEIFEADGGDSFNIIYKPECVISDIKLKELEYKKDNCKNIIDKHLNNKNIRQAIAHEIGHLFLHMLKVENERIYFQGDYKKNIEDCSMIEWEAEEFATILLMPENSFRAHFERFELIHDNENNIIDELAKTYGVSTNYIIKRGRTLNLW